MLSPPDPLLGEQAELAGTVLHGRYEVIRRLGVGGMGAVYEGRRIGLHRPFAIKVLKPDLAESPDNVQRFLREARAASVIQHENIVDIVDFGPMESRPVYFVMEFLEGVDLKGLLRRQGRLPWPIVRGIALEVVSALHAAHLAGIVHRDVKPANCFLVPSNEPNQVRVKVLDFGIAKVVTEGGAITKAPTTTGGVLGTVAYMSPEQAYGMDVDPRTDIYSMGVVLYEMLTGTVPFDGKNPFAVLEAHVKSPPPPPRSIDPTIPATVEALVLRCLEKDRGRRFPDMLALASALNGLDDLGRLITTEQLTVIPPRGRIPTGPLPVLQPTARPAAAPVLTRSTAAYGAPPSRMNTLAGVEQAAPVRYTQRLPYGTGPARSTEIAPPQRFTEPSPNGPLTESGSHASPDASSTRGHRVALASRTGLTLLGITLAGSVLGVAAAVGITFALLSERRAAEPATETPPGFAAEQSATEEEPADPELLQPPSDPGTPAPPHTTHPDLQPPPGVEPAVIPARSGPPMPTQATATPDSAEKPRRKTIRPDRSDRSSTTPKAPSNANPESPQTPPVQRPTRTHHPDLIDPPFAN